MFCIRAQIRKGMITMNIYDFTLKDNKGNDKSLSDYKGKVLLIVNTATKCGLTPQYEELEALYKKYNERGFEILDFPCNQFKEQAPGTDAEITEFCTLNYGTTFPRFQKIEVNGANESPLYTWLKKEKPEDKGDVKSKAFEVLVKPMRSTNEEADIKWNFGKFLIDAKGDVVERFSPAYSPEKLEKTIESLLQK